MIKITKDVISIQHIRHMYTGGIHYTVAYYIQRDVYHEFTLCLIYSFYFNIIYYNINIIIGTQWPMLPRVIQ